MFVREMGLGARFALYATFSLILMVVDMRYRAVDVLREAVVGVIHPVQAALARPFQFLGEVGAFFTVHARLLESHQRLQEERHVLRQALHAQQVLAAENARLRQLLELPPPAQTRPLAAEIIRALPDPFARKLIVHAGADRGVLAGQPVIDGDGLIGQITRVYPRSSELTLLTSREQSVPVQVLRNGLRLIASGSGSDDLIEIRFLDAHADLRVDDELHTSGIDGVYPAGIPVARVIRIEPTQSSPFARAICQPIGGTQRQRQVSILLPATPTLAPATEVRP